MKREYVVRYTSGKTKKFCTEETPPPDFILTPEGCLFEKHDMSSNGERPMAAGWYQKTGGHPVWGAVKDWPTDPTYVRDEVTVLVAYGGGAHIHVWRDKDGAEWAQKQQHGGRTEYVEQTFVSGVELT